MILVGEHKRFISADHIQEIYIQPIEDSELYTVTVQLSGHSALFGKRLQETMSVQMATELRRRLVEAIVNYKSSNQIQHVDLPTREEIHKKGVSENS